MLHKTPTINKYPLRFLIIFRSTHCRVQMSGNWASSATNLQILICASVSQRNIPPAPRPKFTSNVYSSSFVFFFLKLIHTLFRFWYLFYIHQHDWFSLYNSPIKNSTEIFLNVVYLTYEGIMVEIVTQCFEKNIA